MGFQPRRKAQLQILALALDRFLPLAGLLTTICLIYFFGKELILLELILCIVCVINAIIQIKHFSILRHGTLKMLNKYNYVNLK